MRIITGSARGTKLATLEGDATRPTTDRVKEALFSMIQFDIEGRNVLDLFGGCGQLALEALSRGAAKATIIDQSRDATNIIIENAKKTHLFDRCRISTADYTSFIRGAAKKEKYDIIFLDPPYNTGLLHVSFGVPCFRSEKSYSRASVERGADNFKLVFKALASAENVLHYIFRGDFFVLACACRL